jgi:hypothetical protein
VDTASASDWRLIGEQIEMNATFVGLHDGFELGHSVLFEMKNSTC